MCVHGPDFCFFFFCLKMGFLSNHVVDDADGLTYGRCLEAHVLHALVEIIDGDGAALELVEVELLDLLGVGRHLDRFHQHRLGGGAGREVGGHVVYGW